MKLTFDRLREANTIRGAQWDGQPAHLADLSFRAMELGGEAGEACEAMLLMLAATGKTQNVAKKLVRQLNGRVGGMQKEEARVALADELADVVICADRVAEVLGIDMAPAIVAKFNKTSRKHGLIEILPTPAEIDAMTREAMISFLVARGTGTEAQYKKTPRSELRKIIRGLISCSERMVESRRQRLRHGTSRQRRAV